MWQGPGGGLRPPIRPGIGQGPQHGLHMQPPRSGVDINQGMRPPGSYPHGPRPEGMQQGMRPPGSYPYGPQPTGKGPQHIGNGSGEWPGNASHMTSHPAGSSAGPGASGTDNSVNPTSNSTGEANPEIIAEYTIPMELGGSLSGGASSNGNTA